MGNIYTLKNLLTEDTKVLNEIEFKKFYKDLEIDKSDIMRTYDLYKGNKKYKHRKYWKIIDIAEGRVDNILKEDVEPKEKLMKMLVDSVDNIVEKTGSVERKNKFKEQEGGYVVYYDKDKEVFISKDDLRKLKEIYCGKHGMSIEQASIELNLSRSEFFSIKSAFDLYKTAIPYIDEDIDTMTVEEMAEKTRIVKKKAYFRKVEELKYQDMERELKKLHQKDYYFNKFMSEIKLDLPCISSETLIYNGTKSDYSMILSIADWHIGLKANNVYNKFNKDIAKDRIYYLLTKTRENCNRYKPEHIYITNLGDLLNGIIKASNRANSDMNTMESIQFCIEQLIIIINTLKTYAPVTFTGVISNHSRWFEDKTSSINDENFENIITWTLYKIFEYDSNVDIKLNTGASNEIEIYNEKIMITHGDSWSNAEKTMSNMKKYYPLILQGHLHNLNIKTVGSSESVTVGSLVGSDEYASNKELYSRPSQLITMVDKNWNKIFIPVYLDKI